MEGFLLLLLQMALLLLAAAVVFFLLGWRWRAQEARREQQKLESQIAAETENAKRATEASQRAEQRIQEQAAQHLRLQAEIQEANDHRRNLERELIRVHEDFKSARQKSELDQKETLKAKTDFLTAQAEIQQLQQKLTEAQEQVADLEKAVRDAPTTPPATIEVLPEDAATPPLPAPAEVIKPKRPRKTATEKKAPATDSAKPVKKADKTVRDADKTLADLGTSLAAKQTFLDALRQELDDCRRRVASLRIKGNDPAGLGLATQSLARAETQVAAAAADLEHLRHQQSVLRRSLEQAGTLTQEDDLTRIKGIKSVLRDQLHAYGVRSFRQIAEWTEQDVEAFSELLAFKDRAKRDEWVRQARELL